MYLTKFQWLLILGVVLAFLSRSALAVGLEQYAALPSVDSVEISPNGKYIAYRMTTAQQDSIDVFSLEHNKPIAGIAVKDEINPNDFYFLDDGYLLVNASEETNVRGYLGSYKVSGGFVYDFHNNELMPLVKRGGAVYPGQTNLGSVVGVSKDLNSVFVEIYIGRYTSDYVRFGVIEVDLRSNGKTRVAFEGDSNSKSFILGPDQEVLVHELYNEKSNLHEIRVKNTPKWRQVYEKVSEIPEISILGITPDYKNLIVATDNLKSGQTELAFIDLISGDWKHSPLNNKGADVDRLITDLNGVVQAVQFSGFRPTYKFFDPKLDVRIKDVLKQFDGNSVWIQSWTQDRASLIIKVEGPQYSGHFFKVSLDGQASLIAESHPSIKHDQIHPVQQYEFKASDGLSIPTLLTIPRESYGKAEKLAAVVLPHGGPASYDQIGFGWLEQALADQGYLVIQPQFRGSRGFGTKHYYAGQGEWGGKMQQDLDDAVKDLTKTGMIDPDRVCIVGASYGGYAALAAAAFSPRTYKCAVSINGVSDLAELIKEEKRNLGRDSWVVPYFEKKFKRANEQDTATRQASPVYFAHQVSAPVLLLHSENDRVVDIKQSKLMRRALKKANKPVQFVKLKSENHQIESATSRLLILKEITTFLGQFLSEDRLSSRENP